MNNHSGGHITTIAQMFSNQLVLIKQPNGIALKQKSAIQPVSL